MTLIGKTVTKLELSDDNNYLRFTCADGTVVCYRTEGDCCSDTWINDLIGVGSLLGHEVTAVEEVDLPSPPEGAKGRPGDEYGPDVLADYAMKLKTTAGYFDVIYRNNSNGYYGGWLDETVPPEGATWRYVTEDYSA